ncbi:unnamed protein product, partial [Callosobruchus maculatus]
IASALRWNRPHPIFVHELRNLCENYLDEAEEKFRAPVDNIDLQQMIGLLKNGSSPGKDGLLTKTIKSVSKYIIY